MLCYWQGRHMDIAEARRTQEIIRQGIALRSLPRPPRFVAGVDASAEGKYCVKP